MNKLFLLLILIFIPALAISQETEQTLFGGDSLSIGFYGGPDFKFSMVKDEFAAFSGGKGGVILDGFFSIGGGGYNMIVGQPFKFNNNEEGKLDLSYGGLILEYINSTNSAFHFTVNSLIGWGTATYSKRLDRVGNDYENDWDACFVLEPGVNLEMNLTKYMRLNLGGSYRFVKGLDFQQVNDSDISGFAVNLTLKFGFFNKFIIPAEIKDLIKNIKEKKYEEL